MTILIVGGIIVFVIILILVTGFARLMEYLFTFQVKGKVIDDVSNLGVENAQVVFIDTSLDYRRSKMPQNFELTIGNSTQDGSIDLRFDYWWARFRGLFGSSSPFGPSIEFRISKPGYQPKSIVVDPGSRPRQANIVDIDLGSVRLTP